MKYQSRRNTQPNIAAMTLMGILAIGSGYGLNEIKQRFVNDYHVSGNTIYHNEDGVKRKIQYHDKRIQVGTLNERVEDLLLEEPNDVKESIESLLENYKSD